MANENKIPLDIEISSAGQTQINQYVQAFDSLRDSVNGLSRPFSIFSNSVNTLNSNLVKYTDTLTKLNKQNKDVSSTGEDAGKTISDLAGSFSTWNGVLKTVQAAITGVESAITRMEAAATAGIALLVAWGPKIWDFVSGLVKEKDTVDDAKLSLDSMNNALSSTDYTNAIEQVNKFRINVDLAKDHLLSKKKVVEEYNESLGSSMSRVSTLTELEKKLVDNGPNYIQMMLYKSAAQLALQDAAKKAYEAQQAAAGMKPDDEVLTSWDKVVYVWNRIATFQWDSSGAFADVTLKQQARARGKTLSDNLNLQKDSLLKIAQDFSKQAAELAKDSGLNSFTGEIVDTGKPKKQPKPAPHPAKDLLAAQSISFAQTIELDKQNYDKELALLNDQLAKKLISQQQYDEQSQALQEQYHLALGDKIRTFRQTELKDAQRHMQDMVEAQRLADTIPQDEKDVKKAILPGQKFEAEKKLIADKYNYEIAMADGNSQKIKELTAQHEQAITDLTKQYEQQRSDFALQSAQKVSDAAFSILKNNIKAGADAKVKDLESQKDAELSNKSLTANQRKAIEDKYQKKEAEEKTKAFKAEQRASILQAVINGALAVTKATAQSGVLAPFVIPGIIAETAIQVATIAAQKAPQYAKGGLHFKSDGRGALLSGYSHADDTNAYLRSGEAVVVSEAMRNPWARNLVSAINVAYGGRDFSVTNPGRGYAIGGIFTDGGNANRYYSQPANDVKDLANTLAYQMMNNFPPIYVDVKDVNNQQNILAQTVNRVNL